MRMSDGSSTCNLPCCRNAPVSRADAVESPAGRRVIRRYANGGVLGEGRRRHLRMVLKSSRNGRKENADRQAWVRQCGFGRRGGSRRAGWLVSSLGATGVVGAAEGRTGQECGRRGKAR